MVCRPNLTTPNGGARWKFQKHIEKRKLHYEEEKPVFDRSRQNRCRDYDGEIRRKRGDTLVGTLRKMYGSGFAEGVRSDMRLDTLRDQSAGKSLLKIIKN
jgi:hypothetical protein